MAPPTAWVLSNGLVGMDNQSIGLAEALGLDYTVKHLEPIAPWKYLPPALWCCPLQQLGAGSARLEPPWPDAVIGTGRMNVAASVAIRRASGGRTRNIRIQHPRVGFRHFDFIVAPQHDQCRGENVIETLGAVNRGTQSRLDEAARRYAPRYSDVPHPFVVVLVGGSNSQYALNREFAENLARKLDAALSGNHGSLFITPSRRTDPVVMQVLRDRLRQYPGEIWDGSGDNPYFAWLGLADHVIVTADSVNMASEACFTGKPVYVEGLTGAKSKFEDFHRSLQQQGCTRPFNGTLSHWQYTPLEETQRAALQIRLKSGW